MSRGRVGGGETPDVGDGFDVFEVHDLLGRHEKRGGSIKAEILKAETLI